MRLLPDLFHVADAAEWSAGSYARSTRGLDLADVGYVHLAFAWQTQGVLDRFYADVSEPLVLLRVDPERLTAAVRLEEVPGGGERFPHLYGPLEPSCVVEEVPLERVDGRWLVPEDLVR